MIIRHARIAVPDLTGVSSFFANTLDLPAAASGSEVEVQVGRSVLTLIADPQARGAHHLAFNVPAEEFSAAKRWLARRTALLGADGCDEFPLDEPWRSRSVYFEAPGGLLLELVARDRLSSGMDGHEFDSSHIQGISEVGIPVQDVPAAASTVAAQLGLDLFAAPHDQFHAMGDDDGLLILVAPGRTWFPTRQHTPSTGAVDITLGGPGRHDLALTSTCRLRTEGDHAQN